jgi:fructose-bisphosphate aldolase class 1
VVAGHGGQLAKAQQTVFERAKANGLAALGQWGE